MAKATKKTDKKDTKNTGSAVKQKNIQANKKPLGEAKTSNKSNASKSNKKTETTAKSKTATDKSAEKSVKTTQADGAGDVKKKQETAKSKTPAKSAKKSTAKKSSTKKAKDYKGLDEKTLIGIYRTMYMSRRIDDKEIQLKGQNKDIFSDFRRGTRSGTCRRGNGFEGGLRLVFSVLS